MENHMTVTFDAVSENEALARMVVAAFITVLDPTLDEMADVKTAVSEAVTNAIIHGYDGQTGSVTMTCSRKDRELWVTVQDRGKGIEDIKKALEPFYTSRPELERSGMGFAFMEAFMDEVQVESRLGNGTYVAMRKVFHSKEC